MENLLYIRKNLTKTYLPMYSDYYFYSLCAINGIFIGVLIWVWFRKNEGTRGRARLVEKLYSNNYLYIDREGMQKDQWTRAEEFKGFEFYYKANINKYIKRIELGKVNSSREIERLNKIKAYHLAIVNSPKIVLDDEQIDGLNEQISYVNLQLGKLKERNHYPSLTQGANPLGQYFSKQFSLLDFKRVVEQQLTKNDGSIIKRQVGRFTKYLAQEELISHNFGVERQEDLRLGKKVFDFLEIHYSKNGKEPQEFENTVLTKKEIRKYFKWISEIDRESI